MGSTRLPGKVLMPLNGIPMLGQIIRRVRRSELIDDVVVASTNLPQDDLIVQYAEKMSVQCYRGSEEDILDRLVGAIRTFNIECLVSLTGDNPFIEGKFLDAAIERFLDENYDYLGSTHMQYTKLWKATRLVPRGITVQVARATRVSEFEKKIKDLNIRRKGLYCLYNDASGRVLRGQFPDHNEFQELHAEDLRMTVDTTDDFAVAEAVFSALQKNDEWFSIADAVQFLREHPAIARINQDVTQISDNSGN